MKAIRAADMLSFLLKNPASIKGLMTWPKFSASSYSMVASLVRQGIVPRTVLDVGANAGQFAVASAKLFPNAQVHSFEPVPDCYKKLLKNASREENIVAYPLAIGDAQGEIDFHVNSYSHSSSALPLAETHREAFPEARERRNVKVSASTLDRIFADVTLQSPALLKLDVQGYEDRVIRGSQNTLKYLDYVVLEASFKPMYAGESLFADIARLMVDHGFRFERPVGWLEAPETGEILQMDALFARAD